MGEKAMKTTQAWGWLAAGVLALGVNGVYHDGGAAWTQRTVGRFINRIEERSAPILALATGHADWLVTKTKMVTVGDEPVSCRLATSVARLRASLVQRKMARTEANIGRFEAMSAREEAALARVEAAQARIEARAARVRFTPAAFDFVCPRVRVSIPRVRISVPEVHVEGVDVGSF
jgi:hypothetical protein